MANRCVVVETWGLVLTLLCLAGAARAAERGIETVVRVPVRGQKKVCYEESHALIVGINRYPTQSAFRSLSFAVADAEAMRDVLVKVYGFPAENVILITDKTDPKPTRKSIMEGLRKLARVRNRDARVVFYFSGHGQTADVWDGKAGFLIPSDAEISREDAKDVTVLDEKCIPMSIVRRRLQVCQARHRLLLLDACFSGLAISGRSSMQPTVPDYLAKVAFTPVMKVFVAGQAGEEVFEKPEWGHGAFTRRLLEVLKPNDAGLILADVNGDGYVTTQELWGMIPDRVRQMTRGKQNPKDAQEGDGEMLLVALKPEVAEDAAERAARAREAERRARELAAAEARRRLEAAAKAAFDAAERADVQAALKLANKIQAWEKYLRDFQAAGHKLDHARERLAHWRQVEEQLRQAATRPKPKPAPKVVKAPEWAKVSREQLAYSAESGLPVAKELDLGGGAKMRLVLIPPGRFAMGSKLSPNQIHTQFRKYYERMNPTWFNREHPRHTVRITEPFYMSITEVTNEQYRRFKRDHNSKEDEAGTFNKDDQPAVYVSWTDAADFCKWLSQQARAESRLPTEAEWEYACRAGTDTLYWFGDDPTALHQYCNYADKHSRREWANKRADDGHALTAPVASYKPSPWGLYDMHGNVWEWCLDWYDDNYYGESPTEDPPGPKTGTDRVLRGGGWDDSPSLCRSAMRGFNRPGLRWQTHGFRVVVEVVEDRK